MLKRILDAGPDERRRLAVAGATTVREFHDSSGYARAYDKLLRALLVDSERTPTVILDEPESKSGTLDSY